MLQIRSEQFAAMRRKKIGDTLIERLSPFVTASWDAQGRQVLLRDELGPRGALSFDSMGFVGGYTSPLGRAWQLTNDTDGKLLELSSPSGHVLSMAYGTEGLLSAFGSTTQSRIHLFYDLRRYAASQYTDQTTEAVAYTAQGDPALFQSRLGHRVSCSYDEYRRLTSLTDGNGHTTQFLYDRWNRPESVLHPNGQRDDFRFDEEGKLCHASWNGGDGVDIESDSQGHPLKLSYSDGLEASFSYGEGGRLVAASAGERSSNFQYTSDGQFLEETCGPYKHSFAYDASRRLSSITSLGSTVQFRWDADNRLAGFTDWSGGEHVFEYLEADRGYVITAPGADAATMSAPGPRSFVRTDSAGRLASLQVVSAGSTRFSLACSYDAEGRLSTSTDSAFGQRVFGYDADSRVTYADASHAENREVFSYDRAGNLAAVNGTRQVYDAANQLLEAGKTVLRWNDRGNVLEIAEPDSLLRLRYNLRNQLVASLADDGTETVYSYDALGRRTSKRTGNVETRFFWAGEQMLCEIRADLSTDVLRRQDFLYHPETGVPLATCIDGEVFTIHTDHLGTPRAVTSQTGEVVWLAEFSTYGTARITIERVRMPLRFRGQYFDRETGLHYNRFRYYAPQWGRYISRDPLTFLAGTNHYLYASANPLNISDATGLISWTGVAALAAGAAVGIAVGIVLAPIALPLAIIAGGVAAGAVAGGLNEALNEKQFSLKCIAKAAGLGALAGAAGALPFLALPVGAGVLAFMGAGALGGALSYGVNCLDGAETNPSWGGLAASVGMGAVFAGAGKGIADTVPAAPKGSSADPLTPSSPPAEVEALKAANADSVAKVDTFKPQGVSESDANSYLGTPEGQAYMDQLRAADPKADATTIYTRASGQVQSGSAAPDMTENFSDPLVKAVPAGQSVSPYSPFFTTQSEMNSAMASGQPVGDSFGLPLSSQAPAYDIYQITPPATGATVFTSRVAPTTELGGQFVTNGGATQTLVPNRAGWSAPTYLGTVPATGGTTLPTP